MKILISACLLGEPCRYDGQSKGHSELIQLLQKHDIVPFCPEVSGGLPTPRVPAERCGARVINAAGVDVTEAYAKGALACLERYCAEHCQLAILKDKSPSCGVHRCYDGSFSRQLVARPGVTAEYFQKAGLPCCDEHEAVQILQENS